MNQTLTTIFKQLIQSNGLVKSGRLLNSIKVYTNLVNNVLTINITGTDYLYTKAIEYNLTQQFSDNPLVSDEISTLFNVYFNDNIEKYLNNEGGLNLNPQIILLYNGN